MRTKYYIVSMPPDMPYDIRGELNAWYVVSEPIVWCRDCEYYSEHEWIIATDVEHVCHFWHGKPTKVEPNGFCAWGKRKEMDG